MPIHFHCECGKSFWTVDANAGRRMACTRCGRDLDVPQPRAEGIVFIETEARIISRIAFLGLVLGIASIVFGPFTAIPAVIFGVIGRSEIGRNVSRVRGMALANLAIVLGSLGTIVLCVIPLGLYVTGWTNPPPPEPFPIQCFNNLERIGLALHNYHSATGHFPHSAILDKHGRPLLSWRVAILPYMEQQELFDQFKLDEPWDSPHNLTFLDEIPWSYLCPDDLSADKRMTPYQAVVGPGALFGGEGPTSIDQVTDGTSNTLAVVEARIKVPWTKPDDLSIGLIGTGLGNEHKSGSNVLLADGSARCFRADISAKTLEKYGTKAGGEVISGSPVER